MYDITQQDLSEYVTEQFARFYYDEDWKASEADDES